jgi:hypothetical protein
MGHVRRRAARPSFLTRWFSVQAELDRFCDAMISIRKEIRQVETGAASKDNNVLKVRHCSRLSFAPACKILKRACFVVGTCSTRRTLSALCSLTSGSGHTRARPPRSRPPG